MTSSGCAPWVEVPRSSFYDWAAGPTAAAQARVSADAEWTVVIEQVWRESRCTYRWPRVWGQLTRRRGMTVSRRRVARIMREHGFVGAHTRNKWRRGRPEVAPAADHLQAGLGHLTPAEYAARFRDQP